MKFQIFAAAIASTHALRKRLNYQVQVFFAKLTKQLLELQKEVDNESH